MEQNLLTILRDALAALNAPLFEIGKTEVSTLGLIRIVAVIVVALIVSRIVRAALDRVSRRMPGMNRSAIYTVGRILHYIIIAIGVMIGFSTIGIDFTNLAVLVGALGIGVGFGLQPVVANFVAGLLILFEQPLKVGDFVELESGVHGEVREIRMRATRITTNDNVDILVPNSEFVNGRVTNWTLDEAHRRIRIKFGVAYGTDKELVRRVVLEAAQEVEHTLKGVPKRVTQVWLVGFGDSSLDFELVVWLTPAAVVRPSAVSAAYYWAIHTALTDNNIEIPFPQRDLHLRTLFGEQDGGAKNLLQARASRRAGQGGAAG